MPGRVLGPQLDAAGPGMCGEGERTREAQRPGKPLEDTGIKLSTTVSTVLGVSG